MPDAGPADWAIVRSFASIAGAFGQSFQSNPVSFSERLHSLVMTGSAR